MANAASEPIRAEPPNDVLAPRTAAGRFHDLLYEKSSGVATITFNRPAVHNAYSTRTLLELTRAVEDASLDDAVGVIVLTGAGTAAFCTGGDVREYADRYTKRPRDYWKYMGLFQGAVEALLRCGKPTIARLNGMTVGGGNELHLACDLSVAASHAYLGQVGVGVGSVACGGATQWLPLTVGDRRARSMLLLNERVPADRALDWGLVSEVAPSVRRGGQLLDHPTPEEAANAVKGVDGYSVDLGPLDAAVTRLTDRLLEMFPECLRYTKQQVNYWKELAWHNTIGHGREWLTLHFANREPHEGMSAFVEKRRPNVAELRRKLASGEGEEFLFGRPTQACPSCGARGLPEEFPFCGRCGAAIPRTSPGRG
ncbi:MAG TPA: enoyl-CoA hydratase/isomerase family protein [Thermoplasmata archaeon]|nr:enoyl-CoA hydratase/isomerase family protein [Thermoplasmata archaeon]